jgi:hypothetical protein
VLCLVSGEGVKLTNCHFEMGTATSDATLLDEPKCLVCGQGRIQVSNSSFKAGTTEGQGIVLLGTADQCQLIGNHFTNLATERAIVLETNNSVVIGNIHANPASTDGITDNGAGNVLANNVKF